MVAVLGAISSKNDELKFCMKGSYFNQDDTIEFLQKLLNFHKHRRLCMFWDNSSIHKGKKVQEFLALEQRIISIENPEYSPEFNGIETLWSCAKKLWR
jgi:transposase